LYAKLRGKNISQDYWVFGLCPWSDVLKKTTFPKLDLFPPSDERLGYTYISLYIFLLSPVDKP
jgi:hypothetical protein